MYLKHKAIPSIKYYILRYHFLDSIQQSMSSAGIHKQGKSYHLNVRKVNQIINVLLVIACLFVKDHYKVERATFKKSYDVK